MTKQIAKEQLTEQTKEQFQTEFKQQYSCFLGNVGQQIDKNNKKLQQFIDSGQKFVWALECMVNKDKKVSFLDALGSAAIKKFNAEDIAAANVVAPSTEYFYHIGKIMDYICKRLADLNEYQAVGRFLGFFGLSSFSRTDKLDAAVKLLISVVKVDLQTYQKTLGLAEFNDGNLETLKDDLKNPQPKTEPKPEPEPKPETVASDEDYSNDPRISGVL